MITDKNNDLWPDMMVLWNIMDQMEKMICEAFMVDGNKLVITSYNHLNNGTRV